MNMPSISKEEMAKAEAALLAEEQAIKEKWCVLKGHRWDLPGVSPFNNNIMDCRVICGRCNVGATVTVTVDATPATVAPTSVPPAQKKP